MSLDNDLNIFFKRLKKHQDIRYLQGVTPATFFRFLNGSVHIGNISELAENSVLKILQDPERADFISSFFADLRYRGKGLKTQEFRESLMWSYIRLYHPQHLKVNNYHDAYIFDQIKALESFVDLFYSGVSDFYLSEINDVYVNDSLSFFPTVRKIQRNIVEQKAFNKALKTIKNTGMNSLYVLDENLMDVLNSSVREGIQHVMQLYQSDKHDTAIAVILYSLDLYRECRKDAEDFANNFSTSDYNEKRKVLEKKIAFDTVFLYLLLSDFCDTNGFGTFNKKTLESIKPVRPTISYIKNRFNLSSDKVLSLQKEIVMKAILYAVLKRMQADVSTTYTHHRLLREIDEYYSWLDINSSRRNHNICALIDLQTEQHCIRELWATRNPVEPFNMEQYLP
ncbi:hypothetical protein [Yersinia enterocolitica]|uniref:hypothetical protein n=1 Tax=Yersinia enterocolitica TaxID=630 RepID=UPI003D002EC5